MSEEKKENETSLAETLDKLKNFADNLESKTVDGYDTVADGYDDCETPTVDELIQKSISAEFINNNRFYVRSVAQSHIENSEYIDHYPVEGKRLVKNVYLNRTCTAQRINARNQELEDAKKFYEKRNKVSWFQKLFGKKQAVVDKVSEIEILFYYHSEYRKNIFARSWDFIVNNTYKAIRFIKSLFKKKPNPSHDEEQFLKLMLKVEELKKAYSDEAKDDVKITTDEDKK